MLLSDRLMKFRIQAYLGKCFRVELKFFEKYSCLDNKEFLIKLSNLGPTGGGYFGIRYYRVQLVYFNFNADDNNVYQYIFSIAFSFQFFFPFHPSSVLYLVNRFRNELLECQWDGCFGSFFSLLSMVYFESITTIRFLNL